MTTKLELDAWGWIGAAGKLNQHTHDTPDKAIEAMQQRIGKDQSLDDIFSHGFRLVRVRKTIEVVMVLDYIEVPSE